MTEGSLSGESMFQSLTGSLPVRSLDARFTACSFTHFLDLHVCPLVLASLSSASPACWVGSDKHL